MKKLLFTLLGILLGWGGLLISICLLVSYFSEKDSFALWIFFIFLALAVLGFTMKSIAKKICWCGARKSDAEIDDINYSGTERHHSSNGNTHTKRTIERYIVTIKCKECGRTWAEYRYKDIDTETDIFN